MAKHKLFKSIPTDEAKGHRFEVRLTKDEDEKIKRAAQIRNMSVSEFIRRAALGRRADVDYDTEIVLTLGLITKAIRDLHAGYVAKGLPAPEDILRPLILEARAATLRISK
jgi:hypothetical protein